MLRLVTLVGVLALPTVSFLLPRAVAPRRHSASRAGGRPQMAEDGDWDSFSREMRELRQRIEREGNGAKLGPPEEMLNNVNKAWVLIFNPGMNDEGVVSRGGRGGRSWPLLPPALARALRELASARPLARPAPFAPAVHAPGSLRPRLFLRARL